MAVERVDFHGRARRTTRGEEELKEEEEEDNVPVGIVGEKATYNVTAIDQLSRALWYTSLVPLSVTKGGRDREYESTPRGDKWQVTEHDSRDTNTH